MRPKKMEDDLLAEQKLVRFTKKDMGKVKKLAKQKGLSIASFIRMIVLEYLSKISA